MAYIGQNAEGNFTTTPAKDTFNGDGSTVAFTLSQGGATNTVDVFVNNVRQEPTEAYSVDGTTLTFTEAPGTGTGNIYVVNRGPAQLTATHPAGQALEAHSATISTDLTVDNRVGIGTSSPDTELQLSANDSATLRFESTDTSVAADQVLGAIEWESNDSSTGSSGVVAKIDCISEDDTPEHAMRFFTHDASGGVPDFGERMRINSTGNVGIGTIPSQALHVYEDTTSSKRLRLENSEGYADFAADNGGVKIFANDTTHAVDIFSDGNVHIGETSNQSRKFVVRQASSTDGVARFIRTTNTDSSDSLVDIIDGDNSVGGTRTLLNLDYEDDANVDGAYFIRFQDEGGTIGRVEANSSSVSYVTTSDYRLKTNVADYGSAIDKVKNLRPVSFDWINTGNSDVGFIAHELAEHIPNIVSGTKDATTTKEKSNGTTTSIIDPQGVDYGKLTPYLTAALQEAIAKIETLETKVAALEAAD